MKVYISGKIGEEVISDATRAKFARAERMLEKMGYEVTNPASVMCQQLLRFSRSMEERRGHTVRDFYSFALITDIVSLWRDCEAIYMLNDWRKSPGATAEYYFAKATGKRMLFADRHDACEHLIERMYREVRAGNPPGEYLELPQNDAEIAYFSKHLHDAWLPIEGGER